MLAKLEKHIVMSIKFRLNLPTCVDFLLWYSYTCFAAEEAMRTVKEALLWVYFTELNYLKSRVVATSSVALAALSYVVLRQTGDKEMLSCLMQKTLSW